MRAGDVSKQNAKSEGFVHDLEENHFERFNFVKFAKIKVHIRIVFEMRSKGLIVSDNKQTANV